MVNNVDRRGLLWIVIPATTKRRRDRIPNEATPRTSVATVVPASQRYWERAQHRRQGFHYVDEIPHSDTTQVPLQIPAGSMTDLRTPAEAYRSPRIGGKAREAARLAHRIFWTWVAVHAQRETGRAGASLPNVVLSVLWMRTRGSAAVSTFGSGWTWTRNVDARAENGPACRSH